MRFDVKKRLMSVFDIFFLRMYISVCTRTHAVYISSKDEQVSHQATISSKKYRLKCLALLTS